MQIPARLSQGTPLNKLLLEFIFGLNLHLLRLPFLIKLPLMLLYELSKPFVLSKTLYVFILILSLLEAVNWSVHHLALTLKNHRVRHYLYL